jgi:hypothetical protein
MIAIPHELRSIVHMQQRTAQPFGHQSTIVAADDFLACTVDVADIMGVVGVAVEAHAC